MNVLAPGSHRLEYCGVSADVTVATALSSRACWVFWVESPSNSLIPAAG